MYVLKMKISDSNDFYLSTTRVKSRTHASNNNKTSGPLLHFLPLTWQIFPRFLRVGASSNKRSLVSVTVRGSDLLRK